MTDQRKLANQLEHEPTEREWQRIYTQGRTAYSAGLPNSYNPYRGGWRQDRWLEGFESVETGDVQFGDVRPVTV